MNARDRHISAAELLENSRTPDIPRAPVGNRPRKKCGEGGRIERNRQESIPIGVPRVAANIPDRF